ncbi:MAG: PAS domain-containing sensor histidine kinase [Hyphomicrobiales bacterium]
MTYKHFYIQITFRILLILANSIFLAFEIINTEYIVSTINLALLLILQTILLIRYISKVNKTLDSFLSILQSQEYNNTINKTIETKSNKDIYRKMLKIKSQFQTSNLEKIIDEQFFLQAIDHIESPLIIYNNKGIIKKINKSTIHTFKLNPDIKPFHLSSIHNTLEQDINHALTNNNTLIELTIKHSPLQFSFSHNSFNIAENKFNIISLQKVNNILSNKESESYSKIIRILNHEIMNSLTPIGSLASTIKRHLTSNNANQDLNYTINKTIKGLDIIEERVSHLNNFITSYRTISCLPQPNLNKINLNQIISNIIKLVDKYPSNNKIEFKIEIPEAIYIHADQTQIEQVIINLIKNSIDATNQSENPIITIKICREEMIIITITDNGCGIKPEHQTNIYTPFFSTKNNGNGIGLSLVKQIIHNHKGLIQLKHSDPNGTCFEIKLPTP